MARFRTAVGLKVIVGILRKICTVGRKCVDEFKKTMKIVFDEVLQKWNYTANARPHKIGKFFVPVPYLERVTTVP